MGVVGLDVSKKEGLEIGERTFFQRQSQILVTWGGSGAAPCAGREGAEEDLLRSGLPAFPD